MITALTASLDRTEYCRYDPEAKTMRISVVATGAVSGDTVRYQIVRLDGFGVVATDTIPVVQPANTFIVDLHSLLDADGINWLNTGEYELVVDAPPTGPTVRVPFGVSIIPVDEFKDRFLLGVTLETSDVLTPVLPPRLITGVTINSISRDHVRGPVALTWVAPVGSVNGTLSWNGGSPVEVLPTGIQQLVLVNGCSSAYIVVTVDPSALPSVDKTEMLVLDHGKMSDASIRSYIRFAIGNLESYMHVGLEPRRSMTPLLWGASLPRPYTDDLRDAVSWVAPYDYEEWMGLHLPVRRLLKVYDLQGYVNKVQATVIPPHDWIVHDEMSGYVNFIPATGAIISWQTTQATFMNYLMGRSLLQDFWHFNVAHGLRDLSEWKNVPLIEAIGKQAAIDVLLQAGSALKAGISSESTSRDGVSESVSYTQSAMYGMFSHITEPYKEWLEGNLPSLRNRVRGLSMVTL